jgi:hypothetical protein
MDNLSFQATLSSSNVAVNVTLYNNYRAVMDFNWMRTLYTFDITSWSGKGLTSFVTLFLSHKSRDPTQFGSINPNDGAI